VPPLREREGDVVRLADHFIGRYAKEYGRATRRLSPAAADLLRRHSWPGNVRELENVVIRAVLQAQGEEVQVDHLPASLRREEPRPVEGAGSLADIVGNFERSLIEQTLRATAGNRSKAARALKTTERILNYRIRRYQIDCEQFRS